MIGYDLFDKFRDMSETDQDYCLQSFFARLDMMFAGFADSKARPEFHFSKFALVVFAEAMLFTERNRDLPVGDGERVAPFYSIPSERRCVSDEVVEEANSRKGT